MAMSHGKKVAIVAGAVGVGVLLAWLLAGKGAAAPPLGAVPTQPLGAGEFPPSYYNLTFQAPTTVGPGPGYVPLFGFIGFGSQWF